MSETGLPGAPAPRDVRPTEGEPSLPTVVLRFKHSVAGSGISRSGHIRPGGGLIVEYDAAPGHQRECHQRELRDVTSAVEGRTDQAGERRQDSELRPQLGR